MVATFYFADLKPATQYTLHSKAYVGKDYFQCFAHYVTNDGGTLFCTSILVFPLLFASSCNLFELNLDLV